MSLRNRSASHAPQAAGAAAIPEASPLLDFSSLAQQFRGDLVRSLRARQKAESLGQWKRAGYVPEEIFRNARAMKEQDAPEQLCQALLSLNGAELATFEPALERRETAAWLPCSTPIRRRIEKHWDTRRAAMPAHAAAAPAPVAPAESPWRGIDFEPSLTITGEELEPGEIALTFDSGPDPSRTLRVLSILKEHGARATFFLGGSAANEHSAIAQRVRAEGHAVGALPWNDRTLQDSDLRTALREIEQGVQGVAASTGARVTLFRFPYGDHRTAFADALNERKLVHVSSNIDSLDWKFSDPRESLEHLLAELDEKRGGIVGLHDGLTQTEILLPELLRAMRERKLVPVILGSEAN